MNEDKFSKQAVALPHHPASELFPSMTEREIEDLSEDIRRHGQINDIIIYDGRVLDGRSRQIACQLAGVQPRYKEWDGSGSLVSFVISSNVLRRHLTPDQTVAIAVESLRHFRDEARDRQALSRGRGKKGASDGATFRGKASEAAAEAFGVSARQIERAKRVQTDDPAAFSAIKNGDKTVTEALATITSCRKTDELNKLREQWTPTDATRLDERRIITTADAFEFLKSPPLPIDHIVTDPLYEKDALWMFGLLGEAAAEILPPHGMLVMMVGQLYLPEIIAAVHKHIHYRWTICCLHPEGKSATVRAHAEANPFWKHVLVFGAKELGWINKDVVQAEPIDAFWKARHPYAQCPTAFERVLETLQVRPGQVIGDPFMGTAATGAGTLRRLCRFVGCDINPKHVESANLRLDQEWDSILNSQTSKMQLGDKVQDQEPE